MRYFLDTEFYEDGHSIMPISVALVRQDGSHLYIEFPFDRSKIPPGHFVEEHVLPHLRRPVGPQALLGNDIWWEKSNAVMQASGFSGTICDHVEWLMAGDPEPEFWAYFADYDWVLMCQIYGTMMDLPERFPRFCMDLQQWYVQLGQPENTKPPKPDNAHDALVDARWNLAFYRRLVEASHAQRGDRGRSPKPGEARGRTLSAEATLHAGDETWHNGPGWYYIDANYPEDGSVGPFATEQSARDYAEAAGYRVVYLDRDLKAIAALRAAGIVGDHGEDVADAILANVGPIKAAYDRLPPPVPSIEWAASALEAAELGQPIDLRDHLSHFRDLLRLARKGTDNFVGRDEISPPGDRPSQS